MKCSNILNASWIYAMLHTSAVAYLKEIFDGNKNTEGKLKGKPNNSKKK